jgi:hypothetical protein
LSEAGGTTPGQKGYRRSVAFPHRRKLSMPPVLQQQRQEVSQAPHGTLIMQASTVAHRSKAIISRRRTLFSAGSVEAETSQYISDSDCLYA